MLMNKYQFRLLSSGFHDCYYNMGLDEALLESVAVGGQAALRFYGWNPPAVSIGYFQRLNEEVDMEKARQLGFDIVRRISGGGAVLHNSELTYSIIMPLDHPLAGKTIGESYQIICPALIRGLAILGIQGVFSGINDILVEGKKISGNAQTRRKSCLLQHGTILLNCDVEIMFEVLKVPEEKNKGKLISDAKDRVTSLSDFFGRNISYKDTETAFIQGFKESLGLMLNSTEPTSLEDKTARELAKAKFSAQEWLYKK